MTFPGRGARPTDAANLLRRAVVDSAAECLGGELIGKHRASVGLLGTLLGRDGALPAHGYSEGWQQNHVALVHTGSRTVLVCPTELDAVLVPELDALGPSSDALGRSVPGAIRVWVDAHFFSWMYLPNGPRRRNGTGDRGDSPGANRATPERVADPRDLLGGGPLASKAPGDTDVRGPHRIPVQSEAFRIRPGRGAIDVPARSGPAESLRPVSVIGMVPSGGRVSMPGWGSAAVLEATPLFLGDWPGAASGDVWAPSVSTVWVGATHLRREDRWRNGLFDHIERLPLPSPFEPAVTLVKFKRRTGARELATGERLERAAPDAPPPAAEWHVVSAWQGY